MISHYRGHWKANFIQNFNDKIKTCRTHCLSYTRSKHDFTWALPKFGEGCLLSPQFRKLRYTERLIYPWTKAKDKWQTQQLFWEHEAAPVSLQTNRTRLWRWAAKKGLSGYVWRSFWKNQGKPPSYCQGMEKKQLSPPSQLQITIVIWCLPHFPVQGQPWVRRLTSRGWLCPAKPVPLSSQLYLLLSSTADGSLVTFSYYCHSAGRSISNNCSLHASSSMYLAALSLNYSSDHLSLAHSHPFLCFKGQSQMSFSYLQTEVKLHLFLIS